MNPQLQFNIIPIESDSKLSLITDEKDGIQCDKNAASKLREFHIEKIIFTYNEEGYYLLHENEIIKMKSGDRLILPTYQVEIEISPKNNLIDNTDVRAPTTVINEFWYNEEQINTNFDPLIQNDFTLNSSIFHDPVDPLSFLEKDNSNSLYQKNSFYSLGTLSHDKLYNLQDENYNPLHSNIMLITDESKTKADL